MNRMQYDLLLNLIKDDLRKMSIRKPIEPECRLALTLIYLSQGVSRHYLAWTFRMGVSTVREIIIEVCELLWKSLSPIYMAEMNTVDWKKVADQFNGRWQMPNCIGSVDGKHVKIKCPPNSGSKYFNYKKHFSMVLLGFCDANYTFIAVDVGAYGSQSDGGIFKNSVLGEKILKDKINLPTPSTLPNSEKIVPYYFVGDSAFPLNKNLMRPYPGASLSKENEIFNYRLCRARQVIENTFGILTNRWRILCSSIEFIPKNADKVILACTILHNYLKITDDIYNCRTYCPPNYCDAYDSNNELIEGQWREENFNLESIQRSESNNSSRSAFRIRKTLTEYFANEGKIPGQPS